MGDRCSESGAAVSALLLLLGGPPGLVLLSSAGFSSSSSELRAVQLKSGVKLAGLRSELYLALLVARDLLREMFDRGLVVTSVREGRHSRRSRHHVGLAFDFRTRGLSQAQKTNLANEMRRRLGREYYVKVEKTHLHVSYVGSSD